MSQDLQIIPVLSMPFAENTYIVHRHGSKDAIVIDPGLEPHLISQMLQRHQLHVVAILNTHGHGDHIAGNADMKEAFPDAPLMIGTNDAVMLTDPMLNMSKPFGMDVTSPEADRLLNEDEELDIAGIKMQVKDVPGHSPGHIVFILHDEQPKIVFGGDTLFQGSVGRTDLPGGSHQKLIDGIRTKILTLPDDTIVYPGHGDATTVEVEKNENPYL